VNYNKTELTRIASLPASVYNAAFGQTDLLSTNAKDALTTATPRVKTIANALWTKGPLSVNLRGTVYGSTSQHYQGDRIYATAIGTTFIADLNVGYKLTPKIRFDLGANNLFDKQAPTMPLRDSGTRPVSGNVYYSPLSYTPWGINGGYYYARATINF
jgi:iron complex outermembrane receptor protein